MLGFGLHWHRADNKLTVSFTDRFGRSHQCIEEEGKRAVYTITDPPTFTVDPDLQRDDLYGFLSATSSQTPAANSPDLTKRVSQALDKFLSMTPPQDDQPSLVDQNWARTFVEDYDRDKVQFPKWTPAPAVERSYKEAKIILDKVKAKEDKDAVATDIHQRMGYLGY